MDVSIAQAQLFFLALTRILAMIIHIPILGGRSIPQLVKVGLGVLLAVVSVPWQPLPASADMIPMGGFLLGIGRELIIGTLAGFSGVLTFGVVQIAGHAMGLGSGFSAGQILNPTLDDQGTAFDQLFTITAMLIFVVINGHHDFLLAIQGTFRLLPPNSALPAWTPDQLIHMTAGLITAGVQMALPVMGTLLMTDLVLGLLARIAPQMQVFFLGIPLKIALGMIALATGLTLLLPSLNDLFHNIGARALQLLSV